MSKTCRKEESKKHTTLTLPSSLCPNSQYLAVLSHFQCQQGRCLVQTALCWQPLDFPCFFLPRCALFVKQFWTVHFFWKINEIVHFFCTVSNHRTVIFSKNGTMSGGYLRTVTVCCNSCTSLIYNSCSQKWQQIDGCDAKDPYEHKVCSNSCDRECDHYDHNLKIHYMHKCVHHTPKDNCSVACSGRVKFLRVCSSPS